MISRMKSVGGSVQACSWEFLFNPSPRLSGRAIEIRQDPKLKGQGTLHAMRKLQTPQRRGTGQGAIKLWPGSPIPHKVRPKAPPD